MSDNPAAVYYWQTSALIYLGDITKPPGDLCERFDKLGTIIPARYHHVLPVVMTVDTLMKCGWPGEGWTESQVGMMSSAFSRAAIDGFMLSGVSYLGHPEARFYPCPDPHPLCDQLGRFGGPLDYLGAEALWNVAIAIDRAFKELFPGYTSLVGNKPGMSRIRAFRQLWSAGPHPWEQVYALDTAQRDDSSFPAKFFVEGGELSNQYAPFRWNAEMRSLYKYTKDKAWAIINWQNYTLWDEPQPVFPFLGAGGEPQYIPHCKGDS